MKNSKEYMENYYKNNPEKWKKIIKCDICDKEMSITTRSNHYKSKNHRLAELEKKIQNIKVIFKQNI